MASAMTPLANLTLASAQGTVTFSSIPSTYRDLVLILQPLTTGTLSGYVRFNGDSGSNYTEVYMSGTGSTAYSGTASLTYLDFSFYASSTNTSPMVVKMDFMDYSATDKHKTVLTRANGAANGVDAMGQRWASTSAITSIAVVGNASFQAGSTFALYGISA